LREVGGERKAKELLGELSGALLAGGESIAETGGKRKRGRYVIRRDNAKTALP